MICLWMGKTTKAKPYWVNLRSPLPWIHYYQNKRLQVKSISVLNTSLQLNLYPNTQLDLYCSSNLSVQYMNLNSWLTNNTQISIHDLLHSNTLIVVVDLQQLHIKTQIRSSMLMQETLLSCRTHRRIRNTAITLSSVRGG